MCFAQEDAIMGAGRLNIEYIKKERNPLTMKRSSFLTLVALTVAAVGVVIALAAYFKNRSSYLYDDDEFLFDDPEDLEYYASAPVEDEESDSGSENSDG